MSTDKNVQTVKDFFAAIGRGDREALLALVAEDIEWIIPGKDWPLAGTRHGHAGLADLLETASKSMETSTEPREFVEEGDRVLVVGFAKGKIKATNKTFVDDWIFAITVRDGRLTNIREHIDTQALAGAPCFPYTVGPKGRVYSFVPAEVADFKNDPVGRMRTLAKEPGRENVEAVSADLVAMPEATQPADVLWLHLFYHDLHTALIQARGATAAHFNRAVYERLKPGGSYVIVDHTAAVGAGTSDAQSLHRIEPASVREEVEAAGFVLDAESTMLANKDDPHSIKVFDPSIKGETDRFAYRFVKP